MAEAFKNLFSKEYFNGFVEVLKKVVPHFKPEKFLIDLFDEFWEEKELKERARHTTITLKKHLFEDYDKNIDHILRIIQYVKESPDHKAGIEAMFFPDFVEYYGLNHFETSIEAMEEITKYFSCEFAIRPFIKKHPVRTMEKMYEWSMHSHDMVRRLSSEGCRPRLPWGMALQAFKEDPTPILPILERLKNDQSESVRKSVANNLNDISKDNPEIVIDLIKKWKGKSIEIDWIIKHGSRTLLKQNYPGIMTFFGYASPENLQLGDFMILTPKVKIGDSLEFVFNIKNLANSALKVRLEYGMYFLISNGTHSKKVFKISEKEFGPNEEKRTQRKHSFKLITTRRYYSGLHKVSLIINGKESKNLEFKLEEE